MTLGFASIEHSAIGLGGAKIPSFFKDIRVERLQIKKELFDEVEDVCFNAFLKKLRLLSQKNLIMMELLM